MDPEATRTKMAEYFSSINPLSSKIFSEVQLIDESIDLTGRTKELSYDERCAIIDKVIIHDALLSKSDKRHKPIHHQILENSQSSSDLEQHLLESVVYEDECLNQNQTDSLLRFVYPKKPEKYVFDDSGCWVDEHSEPFSYFKQSQTKCCDLENLVQKISQKCNVPKGAEGSKVKADDHKGREEKVKREKKTRAPFCGVNVMGGLTGSHESLEEKLRSIKGHHDDGPKRDSSISDEEKEANLPKQKQNLDLIAELQAKLDKNKFKNMNSSPPPPPPSSVPVIHAPTKHTSTASNAGSPMCGKISKPKAPPPPPPGAATKNGVAEKQLDIRKVSVPNPGTAPKVEENEALPKLQQSKTDEFVVDVSSPCRIATPKTGFDFLDNW